MHAATAHGTPRLHHTARSFRSGRAGGTGATPSGFAIAGGALLPAQGHARAGHSSLNRGGKRRGKREDAIGEGGQGRGGRGEGAGEEGARGEERRGGERRGEERRGEEERGEQEERGEGACLLEGRLLLLRLLRGVGQLRLQVGGCSFQLLNARPAARTT